MINEYQELNINILLTGICNLGCKECFAIDHINNVSMKKMITKKDFQYILKIAKKDKIKYLNLIGGEPSLHPKAIDFIKESLEKDFIVNFSTNLLWNRKFLRDIEPFVDEMSFEITFHGENQYSKERWDKLERNFQSLRNKDVSLGYLISSEESEYESHLETATKYGFDIRWSLAEPTPLAYKHPKMFKYFRDFRKLQTYRKKVLNFIEDCEKKELKLG